MDSQSTARYYQVSFHWTKNSRFILTDLYDIIYSFVFLIKKTFNFILTLDSNYIYLILWVLKKDILTVNLLHQTDNQRISRILFPIGSRNIISVLLCAVRIGGSLWRKKNSNQYFLLFMKLNWFEIRWKEKKLLTNWFQPFNIYNKILYKIFTVITFEWYDCKHCPSTKMFVYILYYIASNEETLSWFIFVFTF